MKLKTTSISHTACNFAALFQYFVMSYRHKLIKYSLKKTKIEQK